MSDQLPELTAVCAEHLHAFGQSILANFDPNEPGGRNAREFAEGIPDVSINALPEGLMSRDGVRALAGNVDINTITICAAILAWGGMRYDHRDKLFSHQNANWVDVAEQIRQGRHSRQTAYELLANLQKNDDLPGMGPAYFTKLIYFLMPRDGTDRQLLGYIMDQWAGCSINLLFQSDIVLMDSSFNWVSGRHGLRQKVNFLVSNQNTSVRYNRFCTAIDVLSMHFKRDGDYIDRALIANGGREVAPWRNHVIARRQPKQSHNG
ncbi:MAG: hypothetical protein ABI705_04320 [Aestuariivirga sp.]